MALASLQELDTHEIVKLDRLCEIMAKIGSEWYKLERIKRQKITRVKGRKQLQEFDRYFLVSTMQQLAAGHGLSDLKDPNCLYMTLLPMIKEIFKGKTFDDWRVELKKAEAVHAGVAEYVDTLIKRRIKLSMEDLARRHNVPYDLLVYHIGKTLKNNGMDNPLILKVYQFLADLEESSSVLSNFYINRIVCLLRGCANRLERKTNAADPP